MDTFTTQNGTELEIQPVSQFLTARVMLDVKQRFEDEHGAVQPPTYKTPVGETFEYDADSIQDETTSDDDKRAWLAYQEQGKALTLATYAALEDAYLFLGVITEPENKDWGNAVRGVGLSIPDDEKAYKLLWLETVCIVNREERRKLALTVKALADPVEVEAATAASICCIAAS